MTAHRIGPSIIAAALLSVLSSTVAFAQGGPPLLTDDPGTPGDGNWEINFSFTVESLERETTFEAPLLDINYGLGDAIQLKFELPWVVFDENGGGSRSGLGNSLLGIKWRFLDEDPAGFSLSVYPQFQFQNPTSSADRGIVDDQLELFLPFEAQKTFGAFSLGVELGYLLRESEKDAWVYGVAFGHEVLPSLELLAEVHGTILSDSSEYDALVNVGTRWRLSDTFTLLASAGTELFGSGHARDETEFIGYLGLQLTF